jgi:hypothetical protein
MAREVVKREDFTIIRAVFVNSFFRSICSDPRPLEKQKEVRRWLKANEEDIVKTIT